MGMFGSIPAGMMNPMLGQQPQQAPMMPQQPAMATGGMLGAQAPKKPGFNDPGGWAERLSAIGDVLGRAGGMGSTGAMQALMQARQQRRELEAARYAPQHIGQAIVRLNPETNQYETLYAPTEVEKPTEFQRDVAAAGYAPGSPEYQGAMRDYVTHRGDPFVNVQLPGNRFYSGPQSGLTAALGGAGGGAPAAAPTAPVGKLTPIQGGAGSQAPRTFR